MYSKDWKISLFALVAVVALSACGDKKQSKPATPFAGIWINQENLKTYSRYAGQLQSGENTAFCNEVSRNLPRFAESDYRLIALLVQSNGEVFRYSPGESASAPGFRQRNIMGVVDAKGLFTPGMIGPDGRFTTSWNSSGYSTAYTPVSQANMVVRGNILTTYANGRLLVFERYPQNVAQDYAIQVDMCLSKWKEAAYSGATAQGYPYQVQPPYPQQPYQQAYPNQNNFDSQNPYYNQK